MKEMIMWDKYDNKYREVVDVEVARGLEADLYEANNRIVDLMNIIDERDEIIDEMIKVMINSDICEKIIKNHCVNYAGENKKTCDNCLKEYFEERCKNAKD